MVPGPRRIKIFTGIQLFFAKKPPLRDEEDGANNLHRFFLPESFLGLAEGKFRQVSNPVSRRPG